MSKILYKRDCPECGKEITYTRKYGLERAIKENRLCFECAHKKRRLSPEEKQKKIEKDKKITYKRDCPECEKEQIYKSKDSFLRAIRENRSCFECYHKKRRLSPKEKLKSIEKDKETRKKRYDKSGKEYRRDYRKTHPEQVKKNREYSKKRYKDHKEEHKLKMKIYRKTEKYKQYLINIQYPKMRLLQKELRKDPLYRASKNMSTCIGVSLKSRGLGKKRRHWESIVGYTIQELKEHLEKLFLPGMTWKNYGRKGWHIDHIIPRSFFRFNSMEDVEFRYMWSLDNLQPLWEPDNFEKNDKMMLWGKEIRASDI